MAFLLKLRRSLWLIDLGPEGGDMGGRIVATGTPEQVARNAQSHTGRFLARVLNHNGQPRNHGSAPPKPAGAANQNSSLGK